MSKYIPPPKDPNYLKRKIYTRNTIKVTNETNPNGQFNIEISSIDSNNRMTIKQYQLFPDQLRMLLEKNSESSNPSQVQYINNNGSFSNITNYTDQINSHSERVSNHPEYTNQNNPSAYHSFKNTIDIKNGNTITGFPQDNSNIDGYSESSNMYGSFTSNNNNVCNLPNG